MVTRVGDLEACGREWTTTNSNKLHDSKAVPKQWLQVIYCLLCVKFFLALPNREQSWRAMATTSDAVTRRNIEGDLGSETMFLILEDVPNHRSHCRDPGCVSRQLTGRPNIKSLFRFNLKDVSGLHYGQSQGSSHLKDLVN